MKKNLVFTLAFLPAILIIVGGLYYLHPEYFKIRKVDTVTLTPNANPGLHELAYYARQAIYEGDFAKAEQIISEVLNKSKITLNGFQPFAEFMGILVPVEDVNDKFKTRIDECAEKNKESVIGNLVRGDYYIERGWHVRGGNYVRKTKMKDMQTFSEYAKRAEMNELNAAVYDPKDPYPYFVLLRSAALFEGQLGTDLIFQKAISLFPDYLPLYTIRMNFLLPQWGGSVAKMEKFIATYANDSKPPEFKYLDTKFYIELYANSSRTCNSYKNYPDFKDKQAACYANINKMFSDPQIAKIFTTAWNGLYLNNKYYAGELLTKQFEEVGYSPEFVKFLLEITKPIFGEDSYVIKFAEGYQSDIAKNYNKQLEYYTESLALAEKFNFPNQYEKQKVLYGSVSAIALGYYNTNETDQAIKTYIKALTYEPFNAEGWANLCWRYIHIDKYDEALTACNKSFAIKESSYALRGRAFAYYRLNDFDNAIKDFSALPAYDSGDSLYLTVESAQRIAEIYSNQHNFDKVLETYKTYPELLDPKMAGESLFSNYNNLCFAYISLGNLQPALDYCNKSLALKFTPQAKEKQLKLMEMLGIKS